MNSFLEVTNSERSKDTHQVMRAVNDHEDLGGVLSTDSNFDDSGFSSSTSDDTGVVVDNTLGRHCECCISNSLVEEGIDIMEKNTQNSLPTSNRLHDCLNLKLSGTRDKHSKYVSSQRSAISKQNNKKKHDPLVTKRIHRSLSLDNISQSSTRNSCGFRRYQTFSNNSIVFCEPRARSANRRLILRDINNNESGFRNINSYLKMPQFKLQDCFQGQGLLSLAACITYTVALMMVFCVIGLILDSLKSFIGTQNLKDFRANIVHSRRPRPAMSSG